MAAAPFPWRSLDSLRRDEVIAIGAFKRAMAQTVDVSALVKAASELVSAPVEARLRSVSDRAKPSPGGVAVVLQTPGEDQVIVEVEPALGAALVSRALRRSTPRVLDPQKVATEPIAGAVGAVCVAAARRAGAPMRIVAAGSSESILASHLGGKRIAASFTVMVEYDAFVAQVVILASAPLFAAPPQFDQAALRSMGEISLSMPVVAAASWSVAAEIASLRSGDAWLPQSATIRKTADGWLGDVVLAAPCAERGIRAELGMNGQLVLREGRTTLGWVAESDEGEMVDKDALIESVGEVPIVVRVEIGTAEMPAREWAALGAGDVISLGRRVGELVVLRVSGVELARGELVEIDGEVGVRITHRTGGA